MPKVHYAMDWVISNVEGQEIFNFTLTEKANNILLSSLWLIQAYWGTLDIVVSQGIKHLSKKLQSKGERYVLQNV